MSDWMSSESDTTLVIFDNFGRNADRCAPWGNVVDYNCAGADNCVRSNLDPINDRGPRVYMATIPKGYAPRSYHTRV